MGTQKMDRMDETKTQAFTLGPPLPEAEVAVLLLHGFTGSPWEVRPLGEALAARGAHVVCPRLPGHGTTPEAMLWAGWPQWLGAATTALEGLGSAPRVALVGLSMGGLLSMVLAARFPTRVQGLVLLAPALKLRDMRLKVLRRLRRLPLLELGPKWVPKESTDIELAEARAQSPLLSRFPLVRLFDLFELQDQAALAETGIGCPSLIVGAVNDHVVDVEAVQALQRRLPCSRLLLLQRGFHIIPRDVDRALALTEVAHFVQGLAT